jgi:hypothetical protein
MCTRADLTGYLSSDEIDSYDMTIIKCLRGSKDKFNILRSCIEKISDNLSIESVWQDYQQHLFDALSDTAQYSDKQKKVLELVRSVKPDSLLDLGGNQGVYSIILHNEVKYAVTADTDRNCIDFNRRKPLKTRCGKLDMSSFHTVCRPHSVSYVPIDS